MVGIIFGGASVEHEVSLWSAQNVMKACLEAGHNVVLIYVNSDGSWYHTDDYKVLFISASSSELAEKIQCIAASPVTITPGSGLSVTGSSLPIDVIFPVIHGTTGEDGVLQGCLEVSTIPYLGCGVSASAIGMDKVVTKILAAQAGIPVAKYIVATPGFQPLFADVVAGLNLPVFVKPASLGSSVGVTKVRNEAEFTAALANALALDSKVLIEEGIIGREIECGILQNHGLRVSGLGEVATTHDFYSYEAKYLDEKGVTISLPAIIPDEAKKILQHHALTLAEAIGVQGLARVDFFYSDQGGVILNEINTLPGFTALSMYPMLWKQEGYTSIELINALLSSALDR